LPLQADSHWLQKSIASFLSMPSSQLIKFFPCLQHPYHRMDLGA